MLPTGGLQPRSSQWQREVPEYLNRASHIDQMDLDSALMQLWQCVARPSALAKASRARKLIKNYYHRDDPAVVILQSVFIAVTTIAAGLAIGARLLLIIANIFSGIVLYYVGFGIFAAISTAWLANNVLIGDAAHLTESRQQISLQYAFDVHCNGFAAYHAITGVAQFFLLPILMNEGFFSRLLGNGLYCLAASFYLYNTFCGYIELPTLKRQELLLTPVVVLVALTLLLTLFTSVNISHIVLYHWWIH